MRIKPRFSAMPAPKLFRPKLKDDEMLVLEGQGGFKFHERSGWKVTLFSLTSQRLIGCQLQKITLEIPIQSIIGITSAMQVYVMRRREILRIACSPGIHGDKAGHVWFVINDVASWKNALYRLALLKVDEPLIETIGQDVGADSRDILWYLWHHRHGAINELARLIQAENHRDVLMLIQDEINPAAEKRAGCSILSFERSRIDPETGESIGYAWWMMGTPAADSSRPDRLLDIVDEGDFIQVILEVKQVEKSDLNLQVSRNQLVITSEKTGHQWTETFRLPAEVIYDHHELHLRNQFLEIRLSKAKA
ncbi:MAG: Hsp20/alpha crystallin family protein [Deltaproteobacteria bacterium]|nr:Hsp20/alpha crystallin family protein [Deltaproteobacteria bacterium]